MKKIFKFTISFIFGILVGYYVNRYLATPNIFSSYYKAFQVGVYTSLDAATVYSTKYKDSIIIKDNELYRVYVAILKDQNNINSMSKYLDKKGIDYYLKDITIDSTIKKDIQDYESLMNNESEILFLEINKMIMQKYKESL